MKAILPYMLLLLLATIACNNTGAENTTENTGNETETIDGNADGPAADDSNPATTTNKKKTASTDWQRLNMVSFKDNKGRVIAQAPYPANWDIKSTVRQGEPSITGPNGVKIMDQPFESFVWTNDPYFQQLYYQSGQKVVAWPGADRLVKEYFVPQLSEQGWTFKKSYTVPEVSKIDKWYNDQLYKAVPMQMEIVAIGSEWESADGSPAFMITHVQVSNSADLQSWSFYSSVLKADKSYFERARKQYIFSMASTRYALEPIMEYNEMEARKAGQSWAAHNQRMAQNQANFEQQQRNFINKSNAINEAIMSGYQQQSASSDRQHQNYIDGIREEDNSYNPSNGDQYKTSIHYNHYWVNSSGDYISTNYQDYNPNLDDKMNDQNWQNLKKQ